MRAIWGAIGRAVLIGASMQAAACSGGGARAPAAEGPLSHLSWMSGTWQGESGGVSTEETWGVPRGDQMLGMSQSLQGGKVVEYELLRIVHAPTKTVLYASPGGRCPPTAFELVSEEGRDVVFENRQHDFPKRIQYAEDHGMLRVHLEGVEGGRPKVVEQKWTRVFEER